MKQNQIQNQIEKRILAEAQYIQETGKSVREIAKHFGVSKSTIHKDMRDRLPVISISEAVKVSIILDYNLSQRHIRGGEATKNKYILQ